MVSVGAKVNREIPVDAEVVWTPTQDQVAHTNLKKFMDKHGIASLDELSKRSTEDLEWFWRAVLDDLQIEFYEPYKNVVDLSRGIPWARWCIGGKMNIVQNALDKWNNSQHAQRVAMHWESEEGRTGTITYGELCCEVSRLANGLRSLGLKKGDAVGLYLPMTYENAISLLAVARIGGIALPLFSGFGAGAVSSRLNDAEAKALITSDGTYRRGRIVAMKPIADEALARCPSVRHCVVLRRAGNRVSWREGRDYWYDELIRGQSDRSNAERTDAEDPVMILYTSGTTGRPKGVLHTHCGFPIKAAQDMFHAIDLHRDDLLFWMTDMGWMMGPWLVFGTLIVGASMMLYDGAPDFPGPDRIWDIVERHGVTMLGLSPSFVRGIMKFGDDPVKRHSLKTLRAFASTGEPWNPTPWMWLFDNVGQRQRPIINYTGGTEISGAILTGNWLKPLKPCAFSGPAPGIAADVIDDDGRSVRGQVGELIIRQPWIGMARGFWKDPDRYLETYWARFPNVWVHGDWAVVDEDGLWYLLGRSDDVIKVAGKRVGPAEVESVLVKDVRLVEAAAIGVPDEVKGEALVCFVILKPNVTPSDELKQQLRNQIAEELGKPLTPKDIVFVLDLPRTRNAKIMRRVIRGAYLGLDPGDLSSLENPSSIDVIKRAVRTSTMSTVLE